jgi:hypothetical protein
MSSAGRALCRIAITFGLMMPAKARGTPPRGRRLRAEAVEVLNRYPNHRPRTAWQAKMLYYTEPSVQRADAVRSSALVTDAVSISKAQRCGHTPRTASPAWARLAARLDPNVVPCHLACHFIYWSAVLSKLTRPDGILADRCAHEIVPF